MQLKFSGITLKLIKLHFLIKRYALTGVNKVIEILKQKEEELKHFNVINLQHLLWSSTVYETEP